MPTKLKRRQQGKDRASATTPLTTRRRSAARGFPTDAKLVRAYCAGLDPGLDEGSRLFLRARSWATTVSGRPGPAHQSIVTNVMDEFLKRATAVAIAVADLATDFADCLTFPSHLNRREMPFWMPRHSAGFEVTFLVTSVTSHCCEAVAVSTARHGWLVRPTHLALPRVVTRRMAINATGMGQYFAQLVEQRH